MPPDTLDPDHAHAAGKRRRDADGRRRSAVARYPGRRHHARRHGRCDRGRRAHLRRAGRGWRSQDGDGRNFWAERFGMLVDRTASRGWSTARSSPAERRSRPRALHRRRRSGVIGRHGDDRRPPRHPPHDRSGLAHRVARGSSPASRAWCATSAWPRSSRRTRWSRRWNSGPPIGVPDNPGAWLMATAKHRAIDRLRRSKLLARQARELGHELEAERTTRTRASIEARASTRRHRRRPPAAGVHRLPSGAARPRRAWR